MFSRLDQQTLTNLPTRRVLAIALAVAFLTTVAIGAVATPALADGDLDGDNETATVIHQFDQSTVELLDVEFDDDRALITLRSDGREPVTVSDAGYSGHGSFDVTTLTINGEETVEVRLRGDEAVGISTPQDGFRYEGDPSMLDVITDAPTTTLVAWAVLAGGLGVIYDVTLAVTWLRRNHENSYKELTTEERIKIDENPVEGWFDAIKRFVIEKRYALLAIGLALMYAALSILGVVPGLLGIWSAIGDGGRVVIVGSLLAAIIFALPVLIQIQKVWNPKREFILSIDARDVLDEALGSEGGLGELIEKKLDDNDDPEALADDDDLNVGASMYSGSPERIGQMDIDGAASETRAPGGDLHIVESFNPRRNRARGTWPGTADDIEIIASRSAIDGNREILRDESAMLRSLLSALPSIQTAADTGAVRAIDRELRRTLAVDGSPIDSVLSRAARGTRFEGFYDDDQDRDELEYSETDVDRDSDETTETETEGSK
ncbi:hypothetical protein [Halovivax gelatinilyticus]|uniref:hypothetical protein n=1 Tax=Halovivax gelatinilyticus TaxID=2961597 RepID=UPI0020CA6635|nr:hypothetical protein [Halovivax gelatinilyticus]